MKNGFKTILILMMILGLSSCSLHDISQEVDSLFAGSVCCKDFSKINYPGIKKEGTTSFDIDEASNIYTFEQGKSFFSAFKLPDNIQNYELDLRSYFSGTVFYPIVTILNENYQIIKVISDETIQYVDSSKTWRAYIGGKFKLNEEAKYLLIHTPIKQVGRAQESTGVIATPYIIMTNVKAQQPFSPAGSLKLMVNLNK